MIFSIAVFAGPQNSEAPLSALHFAKAVVSAGHDLTRVFFYHDGVSTASLLNTPPQDEPDVTKEWSEFGQQHQLEMLVCVASALRRGILDQTEATRHSKPAANLAAGFEIAGLGQLIDVALNVDRLVIFK
ncbi:MAG: tRNA 2-thiouridine synthesizing protein D [Candidatus Azotimanducaceae bacterium]|jgi:tRNA 2-thiouridine synthesizing protein D